MFINIIQKVRVMGFWSWFFGLFSGGSKDIGGLGEDEAKLESEKSELRVIEDKIRLKEAETGRRESKTVRNELEEIGKISRGESPDAEKKDVIKLVIGDEIIRKKLRRKKRLTKKVKRIGRVIENIDRKEEGKEAQITRKTGRPSPRTAQLKQDIQAQERVVQSQEREKQMDTRLSKMYKQKESYEKELLGIDKRLKTEPGLANYRAQLIKKIRGLEQQILNYERTGPTDWTRAGFKIGKNYI